MNGSNRRKPKDENTKEYCWGRHPVLTLMEEAPGNCLRLFIQKSSRGEAIQKIIDLAGSRKIPVQFVDSNQLGRLCPEVNHQGVIALVSSVELFPLSRLNDLLPPSPEPALLILLDHLKDPQNLGAIIRTAEVAGATGVLFPSRRGALPTGSVLKVSAGAALRIPLFSVTNVARTIQEITRDFGFWSLGLDHKASQTIWQHPLPERCLLVVGAEGEGLSPLVSSRCDEIRRIPMKGKTGSLNASVAASVGMFEWFRHIETH